MICEPAVITSDQISKILLPKKTVNLHYLIYIIYDINSCHFLATHLGISIWFQEISIWFQEISVKFISGNLRKYFRKFLNVWPGKKKALYLRIEYTSSDI